MAKILITGGAGFIGSHLTERLLYEGHDVTVFDNLSTGREAHLSAVRSNPKLRFVKGDIRDRDAVERLVPGHEAVFHLSDDSDVRGASQHPDSYVGNNVLGLFHVLEAMRKNGVRRIFFPSSTTVFGEAKWPCAEDYGPIAPLNLYGGAKAASEGLLSAWAHTYDLSAVIFRFISVIGGRMDHGVVHDLTRKLEKSPAELEVLGDGRQRRAYLLIDDCVDAMLLCLERVRETCRVVHVGNSDTVSVREVAEIIQRALGATARLQFSGGRVGWKGDSLSNAITSETLDRLGWKPKHTSGQAVHEAAQRLAGVKARS